ncbi:signal recognition particle 9 kDa protein-domain-containing protein [Xylariaceae sp. FL0662B]|nr:signal recognition particle 9 kDa protein-domain-containing protein [Xylariaceae sp. FL0662B]
MPYYATSQEWLHQSSLLLEARPNTTRITTKYHISKPSSKRRKSKSTSEPAAASATTTPPRGSLTLKTYDPHSGVCLKYRTTKAAEVSRLVLSLGRLGGRMAALPAPEAADEVMADVPAAAEAGSSRAGTPAVGEGAGAPAPPGKTQGQGQQQQGGGAGGGAGGGGKGKKKRGKK